MAQVAKYEDWLGSAPGRDNMAGYQQYLRNMNTYVPGATRGVMATGGYEWVNPNASRVRAGGSPMGGHNPYAIPEASMYDSAAIYSYMSANNIRGMSVGGTWYNNPSYNPNDPGSRIPESSGGGGNNGPSEPIFEFPEFEFNMDDILAQQNAQQEQYRLQQEQAAARAARNNDLSRLDAYWSARLDAAQRATSDVDSNIEIARNHALTLGLDYFISPEQRQERINNLFSEYWSEGDESELESLVTQYGNPEQEDSLRDLIERGKAPYEWEYDVIRGSGPSEDALDPDPDGSESERIGGPVRNEGQNLLGLLNDPAEDDNILGLA